MENGIGLRLNFIGLHFYIILFEEHRIISNVHVYYSLYHLDICKL